MYWVLLQCTRTTRRHCIAYASGIKLDPILVHWWQQLRHHPRFDKSLSPMAGISPFVFEPCRWLYTFDTPFSSYRIYHKDVFFTSLNVSCFTKCMIWNLHGKVWKWRRRHLDSAGQQLCVASGASALSLASFAEYSDNIWSGPFGYHINTIVFACESWRQIHSRVTLPFGHL